MADYTIEKLKDADGNNFAFRDPTKATSADITNAINALDVSDSAVSNQFVTKVSETDGKISVSRAQPTIANVSGLQTALDGKAKYVRVNNGESDYRRRVIGLCRAYQSNTKSYSNVSISCHRINSFNDPMSLLVIISSLYSSGCAGDMILVGPENTSELFPSNNEGFRLVEFTYNGIQYGGIEYYSAAGHGTIDITGYWNDIQPFEVDWWEYNHGSVESHTLNQEISDSIKPITSRKSWLISKASKLNVAHTIQTNLGSTAAASFDGSANVTPGVTGTLPITNGGTGKATANDAANALINGLPLWSADVTDSTQIIRQDTGGTANFGRVPGSSMWNYIKSKISSVLGLTATNYSGKAATAGTADKATDSDKLGGQLPSYYATKSEIPDVSGKADKVSEATANHFAGLNSSGNLIDSGKKASDFATAAQGAKADTAYGWGNHANAGYLTDADLSGYETSAHAAATYATNSAVSEGFTNVGNAITQEANSRVEGDSSVYNQLTQSIQNEADTRYEADQTLGAAIQNLGAVKANADGTNATGTWHISVTGTSDLTKGLVVNNAGSNKGICVKFPSTSDYYSFSLYFYTSKGAIGSTVIVRIQKGAGAAPTSFNAEVLSLYAGSSNAPVNVGYEMPNGNTGDLYLYVYPTGTSNALYYAVMPIGSTNYKYLEYTNPEITTITAKTLVKPDSDGTRYVFKTGTAALGSTSTPVYVNADGKLQACTGIVNHSSYINTTFNGNESFQIVNGNFTIPIASMKDGVMYNFLVRGYKSTSPVITWNNNTSSAITFYATNVTTTGSLNAGTSKSTVISTYTFKVKNHEISRCVKIGTTIYLDMGY